MGLVRGARVRSAGRMSEPSPHPDRAEPFRVTQDGGRGLTADQVRHPRFARPTRGVRLPAGVALTPRTKAAGVLTVAPDDATLTDVSAARDWALPLPPWLSDDDVASVAVARGGTRRRRAGVRGRRLTLPDDHLVRRDGLLITTPARTWLDCAAELRPQDVLAMGDAVLHRRLASQRELARMVRWGRGRRGVKAARMVLPWLDGRAESPPESSVRYFLLVAGIPRPECNLDIIEDGEWLARADLAWPEAKVIVEYDGAVHLPEEQRRYDAARRNLLQDRGWLVIVLTARDLGRPHQMVEWVRSALASRGIR